MNNKYASLLKKRTVFLFVISICLLMVFQLIKMQIIEHKALLERANINSIKGINEESPRGVFLDRNMEVIVSNKPAYTLQLIPSEYDTSVSPALTKILNEENDYVPKILKIAKKKYSPYVPIKIKRDVDFSFIAWYEENQRKLPGLQYTVDIQRDYLSNIKGSHLFGYTKEISPTMLEKMKDEYSMGDYIGFTGIEKRYEKYLKGQKGITYYIVDSKQRRIGRYNDGEKDVKPIKGNDLILTIDAETQRVAEKGFEGKKGGLVAIEPSTGEIIAYVSSPNYDLSAFSTVTSDEVYKSIENDPEKPLFNRSIMSNFPPGSTYKMLLAIAGLEMGVIDENSLISCAGGVHHGRFYKCHGGAHGPLNVKQAIAVSCNSFFYQLIFKVGLDKWAEYSRMFGFGDRTGIDLDGEKRGLIPDREFYDRVYGKNKWSSGLLLNISIGQGEVGVTPMQLAYYTALIANSGKTKVPHLVRGYLNGGKKNIEIFDYKDIQIPVSKKTFDIVKLGMYDVVQGHGTATRLRLPDIEISGKTGTAQNPHGKDHALFVGFAPFENPEIAVAVFVENIGYGGTWAGPIAQDVIKTYIEGKRKRNK